MINNACARECLANTVMTMARDQQVWLQRMRVLASTKFEWGFTFYGVFFVFYGGFSKKFFFTKKSGRAHSESRAGMITNSFFLFGLTGFRKIVLRTNDVQTFGCQTNFPPHVCTLTRSPYRRAAINEYSAQKTNMYARVRQ